MSLNSLINGASANDAKKNPKVAKFLIDATVEELKLTVHRLERAGGKDAGTAAILAQGELERRLEAAKRWSSWTDRAIGFVAGILGGVIVFLVTNPFG